MSSNILSVVLEKLIRRLCLDNFPCRFGSSWRSANEKRAETEETDALLNLLSCPHSPWQNESSWSPQASALRQLAVIRPEPLNTHFVYSYFTTLRIIDKNVSIIDDGLLRFSKLEELVLSANKISEIPAENLPSTLKILELCANQVSALNSFTVHPPPHLEYLGLSSNRLGSQEDISHFTGRHWPQLVCLDLSDCEFQDQQALLKALSTLPCLRTLLLEGNPFTLASCYPGFTVDSLPQLSCLDALWISPEERRRFGGLTEMRDLIMEQVSATVSVGRMRGIPDPMMSVDENAPDFPLITYSYFISYGFFSHQPAANLMLHNESKCDPAAAAQKMENSSSEADLSSDRNCEEEKETSESNTQEITVHSEETCCDVAHVSRHSTSKLAWSDCMDFSNTQTHIVSDLGRLKRFFNEGLHLRIEEEKILSWPAASEDITAAKPSQAAKEKKSGKGKETSLKSGSTKDKSKDKKKKPAQELVQDAPITRVMASVHVPLQSLLRRGQKVEVLCNFGFLHSVPEVGATQTCAKDQGKKIKEEKKKEEKEPKQREGSSTRQKNSAASKGKEKERTKSEVDDQNDNSVSVRLDPMTVELIVELEKWQSASEAQQILPPHQNS
ncbi:leucine-rich repeat-containing protein 43-like [Notolabrus celidotus]|uniref:leucine-rich repeat-containing protein 43-like n=1 Tax=Notolabrus celidotus TaxID=1203425 RepID=UPI00148F65BC|nr:leucine-rich repeat-containing protein 43-like [Notolabrus celidotus]